MRILPLLGLLPLVSAMPAFAAPALPPFALEDVKASTDIRGISLDERGGRWEVTVKATRPVPYTGRKLKEGNRYFVDFPDCRLNTGETVMALNRDGISVRAAQFSVDPAIVRVVIQSTGGNTASLVTSAPSDRAVIALPKPERSFSRVARSLPLPEYPLRTQTRIEFSALSRSEGQALRRAMPSRSTLASRGGRTNRLDLSQFVFPPDAMEAYDDPPVPSNDGGSVDVVLEAELPESLKAGAKLALSGNRKYVWGGETPQGFDCSGMVQFIYKYAGVRLPRTAAEQYSAGTPVDQDELRPGDLVFFSNGKRIFHVGMYIGNGRIFHAANPRRGLTTDLLSSTFYASHYAGARRPTRQG